VSFAVGCSVVSVTWRSDWPARKEQPVSDRGAVLSSPARAHSLARAQPSSCATAVRPTHTGTPSRTHHGSRAFRCDSPPLLCGRSTQRASSPWATMEAVHGRNVCADTVPCVPQAPARLLRPARSSSAPPLLVAGWSPANGRGGERSAPGSHTASTTGRRHTRERTTRDSIPPVARTMSRVRSPPGGRVVTLVRSSSFLSSSASLVLVAGWCIAAWTTQVEARTSINIPSFQRIDAPTFSLTISGTSGRSAVQHPPTVRDKFCMQRWTLTTY
jgi:hypothetical protein